MTTIQGEGDYRYTISNDWAKIPDGMAWGEVAAVAVDDKDQVYVFNRGPHPMMVFDRDGSFLRSWGEDIFVRPHGAHIADDGILYLTDDGRHTVSKCTLEGQVLLTLGVPGEPSALMSLDPFNRCTHTALSPTGEIYVSDGYGNACVHKYSPDGKHLLTWGGSGSGPGEFNLPHNICCDADGWVYVADRESHRVQVFDGNGRFETQWTNVHRPCGLFMPSGQCPVCYIGELGPVMPVNRRFPNLGPRISIADNKGNILARIGNSGDGEFSPEYFIAPHGLAVDSHGDVYVGEVSATAWPQYYPDTPAPNPLPTLRKMTRV
jgi:DNA-binding beta-propeller fold protein YncE